MVLYDLQHQEKESGHILYLQICAAVPLSSVGFEGLLSAYSTPAIHSHELFVCCKETNNTFRSSR